MQQDPNFGGHGDEPRVSRISPGMSAQEERTWSMVAHLSGLLLLILGPLGMLFVIPFFLQPVAPLVIWLIYKDKSELVAFHALQSVWYQVAWAVIFTVYWIISFILAFVLVGFFTYLLMPVIGLIPIAHQCYAAYKVNQGVNYRYPVIADMVDKSRRFV